MGVCQSCMKSGVGGLPKCGSSKLGKLTSVGSIVLMLSLFVVVGVLHDRLKARATVSLAEFGLLRVIATPHHQQPHKTAAGDPSLTLSVPNKDAQCMHASILGANVNQNR